MPMTNADIRINGIYDFQTLQTLIRLKLCHFSFDFRPTSLNFLQRDKFLSFVKQTYKDRYCYYMMFEYEKGFILDAFIEEINNLSPGLATRGKFFFELTGERDKKHLQEMIHPFLLHLGPNFEIADFTDLPLLKGIVIPADLFEMIKEEQARLYLKEKIENLVVALSKDVQFDIQLNWQDTGGLSALPQVPRYTLGMDPFLENNYRQVDQVLLETEIKKLKNLILRNRVHENIINK